MINIILQASVIIFFVGGMMWVLDDDYLPEVRLLVVGTQKKLCCIVQYLFL
jgi:hypothetical protein